MNNKKIKDEINRRVIKIKLPSAQIFSNLAIPMSVIVSGILISTSMLSTGSTIKTGLQNLNLSSAVAPAPTDTPTLAKEPTVTIDQVKSIFSSKKYITFGDENSPNLFVEFSDPSCPYCHAASGKNPELSSQMGAQFITVQNGGTYKAPVEEMRKLVDAKKASFAFLYTNGHGNGKLGTQAMYCAYDQGKFWEVHDALMTNKGYTLLNEVVKNDLANSSKLAEFLSPIVNQTTMLNCLKDGKYENRVNEENQFAGLLGIQGTPGFFVNSTVFSGAVSFSEMLSKVKQ